MKGNLLRKNIFLLVILSIISFNIVYALASTDTSNFISIIKNNGYTVNEDIENTSTSHIEAIKGGNTFIYIESVDSEEALEELNNYYNSYKTSGDAYTDKTENELNDATAKYSSFQVTVWKDSDKVYATGMRIDNTVVVATGNLNNKSNIDSIMKELGYYDNSSTIMLILLVSVVVIVVLVLIIVILLLKGKSSGTNNNINTETNTDIGISNNDDISNTTNDENISNSNDFHHNNPRPM